MIDYRLYLVTDDPSRYIGDWVENVVAAVEGGVTCVQYRDTENDSATQYERILRLRDALLRFHTPIVVNNDAVLAKAVGAEGVHVGQHDLAVERVRSIVGVNCEIGLSITASGQSSQGADCLGIGPVFDARKTKADAAEAMGVTMLRDLVESCASSPKLPTVAIGGITLENAFEVLSSGVTGLAVVSAFSKAADPYLVAREFRKCFK